MAAQPFMMRTPQVAFGQAPAASGGSPQAVPRIRLDRIKSWIADIQDLEPNQMYGVSVQIQSSLSNTSPQTNDYKVPANLDFAIMQIQGFLRFTALNTEPTTILGWQNPTILERWLIKAQNCTVNLQNLDRKYQLFDNNDMTLSTLMAPMGNPIVYPPEAPILIPANQIIRGTFTLQDSTTAVIGNATFYGVTLSGVLIPRKL